MSLSDAEVERRIVAALDATAQAVAAADRLSRTDIAGSTPHELVLARPQSNRRSQAQSATLATLAACVVSGLIAAVLIVVTQSGGGGPRPQPGGSTTHQTSPVTSQSPTGSSSGSCEPTTSKSVPSSSFTPTGSSSPDGSASAFYFSSSVANSAGTSLSGCAGG